MLFSPNMKPSRVARMPSRSAVEPMRYLNGMCAPDAIQYHAKASYTAVPPRSTLVLSLVTHPQQSLPQTSVQFLGGLTAWNDFALPVALIGCQDICHSVPGTVRVCQEPCQQCARNHVATCQELPECARNHGRVCQEPCHGVPGCMSPVCQELCHSLGCGHWQPKRHCYTPAGA